MSGSNRVLRSPSCLLKPSTIGRIRCRLSTPAATSLAPKTTPTTPPAKPHTTLQEANPRNLPEIWFDSTFPLSNNHAFFQPSSPTPSNEPDENKVKLGKSTEPPTLKPRYDYVAAELIKTLQPSAPSNPASQPSCTPLSRRKSSRRPYPCTSSLRRTRTSPPCAAASPTRPPCGHLP